MVAHNPMINVLASQHPMGALQAQPSSNSPKSAPNRQPFPAWSALDEVKKTVDTASQKAQSKTGKIEPWSAQYYAACTVGGLLACVSNQYS